MDMIYKSQSVSQHSVTCNTTVVNIKCCQSVIETKCPQGDKV